MFDSILLAAYSASQGSHAVFPHAARKVELTVPLVFGIAVNSLSARFHPLHGVLQANWKLKIISQGRFSLHGERYVWGTPEA
jgi:hypothetical protein